MALFRGDAGHVAGVASPARGPSLDVSFLQGVSVGKNGGRIVLVKSSTLESIQGVVRVLRHLSVLLPILTVACLAGAVLASRDRRRGLVQAGAAVVTAMAILIAILALLRAVYFHGVVGPNVSMEAASAIFSSIVSVLRQGVVVSFLVGLVVALGAALAGPSRPAVWVRSSTGGSVRFLREQTKKGQAGLGPVGPWVGRNRGALRIGIVILGFVVLIAWANPSVWTVLGLALIVVILLEAVEAIARGQPAAHGAESGPASQASKPSPSKPLAENSKSKGG